MQWVKGSYSTTHALFEAGKGEINVKWGVSDLCTLNSISIMLYNFLVTWFFIMGEAASCVSLSVVF